MVDRIRWDAVSYLPFYYVFFQFLLLTIFNLQANILTTKAIFSNLALSHDRRCPTCEWERYWCGRPCHVRKGNFLRKYEVFFGNKGGRGSKKEVLCTVLVLEEQYKRNGVLRKSVESMLVGYNKQLEESVATEKRNVLVLSSMGFMWAKGRHFRGDKSHCAAYLWNYVQWFSTIVFKVECRHACVQIKW